MHISSTAFRILNCRGSRHIQTLSLSHVPNRFIWQHLFIQVTQTPLLHVALRHAIDTTLALFKLILLTEQKEKRKKKDKVTVNIMS